MPDERLVNDLSAADPLRRLERLLAEDTARLADARARLAEAGDALMQVRARMNHLDLDDDPGVQVLAQEVATPIIDRLAGTVDRVDNVVLAAMVGAGADDLNARNERHRAEAGQRQRAILHSSVLDDDLGRVAFAAKREWGQRHRMSDAINTEFLVLGEAAVITLETWGDVTSPYIVIRNPTLVRSFSAWFDAIWAVSPAFEAGAVRGDEHLLRLLALGAKDESIARTLGLSLRTVRRRVAGLMDQYGVSTRFQLGVALERDGRL